MPSDIGDESGELLFNWMLKVGQDASEAALLSSANRLKTAIRNARGEIASDGSAIGSEQVTEWAKLRMAEFESLEYYDSIKEIIDTKLSERKIEHEFFSDEKDNEFLLFRVSDAPDVSSAFEELEKETDHAFDKALEVRGLTREQIRDKEPLEERVASARKTSKALDSTRTPEHDIELAEVRTK